MAEGFKKVAPGQRYAGFPAPVYNAALDVINAHRSGDLQVRGKNFNSFKSGGVIACANNSGKDLDRHHVLGIDAPLIDPTADLEEFRDVARLSGIVPQEDVHEDKFVVLLQPLKAGETGYCCASGVTVARVDIVDPAHLFVRADPENTDNLVTSDEGAAQLLWSAGSSGVQECVIRIGVGDGAQQTVVPVRVAHGGGGSCSITTQNANCVFGGEVMGATDEINVCSGPFEAGRSVWLATMNTCPTAVTKLPQNDFFLGFRLAEQFEGNTNDVRELFAVLMPYLVMVNEDDGPDYLEQQFKDHTETPGYATGDILIELQTDDDGGDKVLRLYANVSGYSAGSLQVLAHNPGSDALVWKTVAEQQVLQDLRLGSTKLEGHRYTVKVIETQDNGWVDLIDLTTECPEP